MQTLCFKPLDEHCLSVIKSCLKREKYVGSDFSYFGYLIWFKRVEYAENDVALFLRACFDGKLRYWRPLTKEGFTIGEATKCLPPCSELFNCTAELAEELKEDYDAILKRDYSEYIYLAEDFISLKGKRYNQKRNHIHKFKSLYSYSFDRYSAADRAELLAFEEKWFEKHVFSDPDAEDSAMREREIMFAAVDASLESKTVCELLRVDGKLAGFSVGELTPSGDAIIIYEKADVSYDGIYSFLANEFAARNFSGCKYINRQEDMGLEGLRKSKLSYCPEFLLDKYALCPKKCADVVSFEANILGKFGVKKLGVEHFNLVMGFLLEGIDSLDDKKFFLNYTDEELMQMLSSGHMLGAFDNCQLIATAGVDLDRAYGDKLASICGSSSGRQFFEFSGIMVKAEYRGQGVASALCGRLLDWAAKNVEGSTLCAVVQRGNEPSLGNLAKLGFKLSGEAPYREYDFLYLTLDI